MVAGLVDAAILQLAVATILAKKFLAKKSRRAWLLCPRISVGCGHAISLYIFRRVYPEQWQQLPAKHSVSGELGDRHITSKLTGG